MTDQQLALQAINEAQLILEDYQMRRPNNNAAPRRQKIRTGSGGPIV
jgi:hypothetical protein